MADETPDPKTDREVVRTVDPAAAEMLAKAQAEGVSTAFSRAEAMRPCPTGAEGACCKHCFMGPCRFMGKDKETVRGVCGATLGVVASRNFARAVAAGTSAHSDHGRDLALALRGVAKGDLCDYQIKDTAKLYRVAERMGIPVGDREVSEIALDVAEEALANFGRQEGELTYIKRAPTKQQEIWRKYDIVPRGIDREVVETMHRTTMGTDQSVESIMMHALRCSLGDGWGGAMLASDISDIMFGTPDPVKSAANLGVLEEKQVNILVHGHDPLLSELIVAAATDPEMVDYAKSRGAEGVNLAGICCTANEILMRHGIPVAGNFLHQELAILTGAVDGMVVDVQCVMQALGALAEEFHTKLITTSPKARIDQAMHIPMDHEHPYETAKAIVKAAADAFTERKTVAIPRYKSELIAGFSHEYIDYMLGGKYRSSFRPLNDAIMSGRIQGVVGLVGCNNPRKPQDDSNVWLMKEFISRDVLVVVTGCAAQACAKQGFLLPEAALEHAGPGLREVCEAVGIPPVLHLGSCVDNTRILTVLTQVCAEGGLGDDISQVPAVGICAEYMSEKAIAIACYFVASGAYVVFGADSPVGGSQEASDFIMSGWEERTGGKLEFEPDSEQILAKSIAHITAKRKALGLTEYVPGKFGGHDESKVTTFTEEAHLLSPHE